MKIPFVQVECWFDNWEARSVVFKGIIWTCKKSAALTAATGRRKHTCARANAVVLFYAVKSKIAHLSRAILGLKNQNVFRTVDTDMRDKCWRANFSLQRWEMKDTNGQESQQILPVRYTLQGPAVRRDRNN